MNEDYTADWDENQLTFKDPRCMDTPSLIEYIERELETPEETQARHAWMKEQHFEWHRSGGGAGRITACCITAGEIMTKNAIISMNEYRGELKHDIIGSAPATLDTLLELRDPYGLYVLEKDEELLQGQFGQTWIRKKL